MGDQAGGYGDWAHSRRAGQHQDRPPLLLKGRIFGPHPSFGMMVGYQKNIRKANVPIGLDGVVRYMPLWQAGGDGKEMPAFALTLAERAGFDPAELPANLRFIGPNYADAKVAPVYAFQDVHQCASEGAIEALEAAFAGKIVLLGAAIDIEDRKVTSGRAFHRRQRSASLALRDRRSSKRTARTTHHSWCLYSRPSRE